MSHFKEPICHSSLSVTPSSGTSTVSSQFIPLISPTLHKDYKTGTKTGTHQKKVQKRRHSSDLLETSAIKHEQLRRSSSFSQSTRPQKRTISDWSEYSARRSIVKFRSRKTQKMNISKNDFHSPPSPVQEVLQEQYHLASSLNTNVGERLLAVVYCWFFGWMDSVHSALTTHANCSGRLAWTLSCLLVTIVATISLTVLAAILNLAITFVAFMIQAGLRYFSFLLLTLVLFLGLTAIFRFDLSQTPRTMTSRKNIHLTNIKNV